MQTTYEWVAAAAPYLNSEIERLRRANDGLDLSTEQTAAIRGELRLLKRILGLPEQAARDAKNKAPA